ncbi:hypothetical protein [Staphylococcus aureus]|uniref:hypothetical protein n=1 Tax=Staphylococcus aureus TaxID=1280 RepID=UPI0027FA91B1|nr:hypothetical protein [Staphylococcus aureus]MDQ7134562.1 hypothetical protein [Staphylococcus aureus]
MTLSTKKVSENIKKLKELKSIISDVSLNIKGEVINVDLVKKTLKNKTIYTVSHEEFPESENVIRLYLPLMGETGYVPEENEIIRLFQGESITPPKNAFLSKKSKPYSLEKFEFNPLAENVYKGKVTFYGESIPYFAKDN